LLLFAPCADEHLTKITVYDVTEAQAALEDEPGAASFASPAVWTAVVLEGEVVDRVVLGVETDQLDVEAAVAAPIAPDRSYAVEAEFVDPSGERGSDDVTGIRIGELRTDSVLIGNPPDSQVVPIGRFEEEVRDDCNGTDYGGWVIAAGLAVGVALLCSAFGFALIFTRRQGPRSQERVVGAPTPRHSSSDAPPVPTGDVGSGEGTVS
jgi:hypothetical protein